MDQLVPHPPQSPLGWALLLLVGLYPLWLALGCLLVQWLVRRDRRR